MEIRNENSPEQKKRPKKPVDHFKKCPSCGDPELIELNPDVLCSKCPWDSTAWHVAQGGMDDLASAAREFEAPVLRSKMKIANDEFEKPDEGLLRDLRERILA